MMKRMKRLLSLALATLMAVSLMVPAYAAETDINAAFWSHFAESCDKFFAPDSNYGMVDGYGNDITEQFYTNNIGYYRAGQFALILNNMLAESAAFHYSQDVPQPRAAGTTNVSEVFDRPVGFQYESDYQLMVYLRVTVKGHYTYDTATKEVLSATITSGEDDIKVMDIPYAHRIDISNFSTDAYVPIGNTQACFYLSFVANLCIVETTTGSGMILDSKGPIIFTVTAKP